LSKRRSKKGDHGNARQGRREDRPRGKARQQTAEAPGPSRSNQAAAATARPSGRRWWDLDPNRLQRELDAFRDVGADARTEIRNGRIFILVRWAIANRECELRVAYPDLFPYFRFEIFAPTDLGLTKHQNPYGGNLCLLDQSTAAWEIDDTAAEILTRQLPKLEQANADQSPRPDLEIPQAEPVTFYFDHSGMANSVILLPTGETRVRADQKGGDMTVEIATDRDRFRGYVRTIDDRPVTSLELNRSLRTTRAIDVRWTRLEQAPPVNDAVRLIPWLLERNLLTQPKLRTGEFEIAAVTFPEETQYGGGTEDGWVFVLWRGTKEGLEGQLIRAERFEPALQAARIPALGGLSARRVALFGCGGLGGPVAHLLMQMRIGELRLVDHDLVRVGNAVRWPLGIGAAGIMKNRALAEFGQTHYPETRYEVFDWRLGMSSMSSTTIDEIHAADDTLDGVDLVIDATAELGVQLFLSDQARRRNLHFITVESREGAFGGLVVRYRAGRAGCYNCFKLHQRDGLFTVVGDEVGGRVQPRGCATPTFVGAPFDLAPLAAQAARLVAQTLVAGPGLPDTATDIALFQATAPDWSTQGLPRWEHHVLTPHPECIRCSRA
jgi:hypothetical protein